MSYDDIKEYEKMDAYRPSTTGGFATSAFKTPLYRMYPFDYYTNKLDHLTSESKASFEEGFRRTYDLYNATFDRTIKSYNAYIHVLKILRAASNDEEAIKLLKKFDPAVNWESQLDDDSFISRICVGIAKTIEANHKMHNRVEEAFNSILTRFITTGKTSSRDAMFSAPASNCEMTGLCVHRPEEMIPLYSCMMDDITLIPSKAAVARRWDM